MPLIPIAIAAIGGIGLGSAATFGISKASGSIAIAGLVIAVGYIYWKSKK